MLQESVQQYDHSVLARLSGGDFGMFLPDITPWEAGQILDTITGSLGRIAAEQLSVSDNIAHMGAATFDTPATLSRLLSEADQALGVAMQKQPNCWESSAIGEETDTLPLGQQQWQDLLVKALENRSICLEAQRVAGNSGSDEILHLEIFLRIVREDGTLLNAATFIPLAERLKLVSTIDRIVIEELTKMNLRRPDIASIAVNLSASSLQDDTFRQWVYSLLRELPAEAPRLIFEFSEFAAVQHLDLLKEFSAVVRECGHAIGLDHFGQSFTRLGYLNSLKPEYVKIDRAYTGELRDEESDSRFYIGSLCSVAHSIDIGVIAEGVETEQQARILKELNLDGLQGYFIGRPQPLAAMIRNS